jgi:hypothetical protein
MGRRKTISTLAATLALTAGCGSAASPAAVTWAGNVCSALSGFAKAVSARPTIDRSPPLVAVQQLDGYFGSSASALQGSIDGLDAAGPAPVAGGDEYVGRLKDTLNRIRAGFEDARTRLAGADTSSTRSWNAALPAVMAPIQELSGLADPTAGMQSTDELRAATGQAPSCRGLQPG